MTIEESLLTNDFRAFCCFLTNEESQPEMKLTTESRGCRRKKMAARAAARAVTNSRRLTRLRALATAPTPGAVTLDAPFISDTMPLAEGVIGELGEVCVAVGDEVGEGDPIAIIETGIRPPPAPFLHE